jgi:Ala-tRNA(Pro) deacylase
LVLPEAPASFNTEAPLERDDFGLARVSCVLEVIGAFLGGEGSQDLSDSRPIGNPKPIPAKLIPLSSLRGAKINGLFQGSSMSLPGETPPEIARLEAQIPSADEREEALYERLRLMHITWRTHAHVPVFTVEEARNLRGQLPGTHTKNLFLEDKRGNLWLVVAREELRVDLNALSKAIGAPRFSFGRPENLVTALGIAPGAVTPFAMMNAAPGTVTIVLDRGMMDADTLNFHPCRNDRTTAIAAADLVRFLEGSGHAPRIENIPERPAA